MLACAISKSAQVATSENISTEVSDTTRERTTVQLWNEDSTNVIITTNEVTEVYDTEADPDSTGKPRLKSRTTKNSVQRSDNRTRSGVQSERHYSSVNDSISHVKSNQSTITNEKRSPKWWSSFGLGVVFTVMVVVAYWLFKRRLKIF